MKLIKEFTRQCCNALQGVSCWPGAISEVVGVVAHKVCASVCGQRRTISQEKHCRVLAVLPGGKLAGMHSPRLCKGSAIGGFYPALYLMWHQSCDYFLISTVMLFASFFSQKLIYEIYIKDICDKMHL